MKITVITVSPSAMKGLLLTEEKCKVYDPSLRLSLYNAMDELGLDELENMKASILEADLTFIDLMGSPPSLHQAVDEAASRAKGHIVPYGASSREHMRLGAFGGMSGSSKPPSMEAMKRMQSMSEKVGKILPGKMRDMRNYSLMMKYFQNGTQKNYDNLILLILKEYGHFKGIKVQEPEIPLALSFYDYREQIIFERLEDYEKAMDMNSSNDALALLFNPSTYPMDTKNAVEAMAKRFSEDFDVYAVALSRNYAEFQGELEQLFSTLKDRLTLVVNTMPFRLGAGPMGGDAQSAVELLEKVDAPYLHPFFLTRRTQEQWQEDPRGCSTGETLISVILPELDGAQETLPLATLSHSSFLTKEKEAIELEVIPERLESLAKRAKALAKLKRMENKDKRIAILCYNYPPGEANLFGGAFLDTFQSIARILALLKEQGYDTQALSAEELQQHFSHGGMVNEGCYESDYDSWLQYDSKEYSSLSDVEEAWGRKPGDIMTYRGKFLIPGIQVGKVFIGLQPSRGRGDNSDASYHDKSLPPHHQYVAYYQWIEQFFGANALLHVGTHGTLEFLKGKEIGMSGTCYPDRLVGSLPHIYLYYCGNPAEAMIAKRRSHANLVSYMPPVFVEGGLYGELLELQTEIENYQHAAGVNPSAAEEILAMIKDNALRLGLSCDLDQLETQLLRYQNSLIPKGLHIFGEAYSEEEQEEYERGLRRLHNIQEKDHALLVQAKAAREAHEKAGLLHALEGGYAKSRLGGDIYRNPEVLPSGANLFQFDPRLVPSKLAMQRGKEICQGTLNLFLKEKGTYPKSVAVILWGLETSRTQGETLGQILAYLGVEIDFDSTTWNRKFRIVPLEELGRPRIDVTVNICGFFRDMFGDLLDTLADLFEEIQELDEPEELNHPKAHGLKQKQKLLQEGFAKEEAHEYARARIFGPREGEYGTSLTGIIETKDWEEEEALGFAFTASLRHAYSRRLHGKEIKGLYETNLKTVEIVSQLRSSHEYEITDLDHYYEFFGGLAKSVEIVRGEKAQMYISDTTQGKNVTETVDAAINRGLRTRVLNPKWSDGLLEHSYHGAQEIAQRFENVMGLAATTGAVEQRLFDDLEHCYVEDEKMSQRMEENNPHAYMDILEQMMEYHERGYWEASEEQLQRLRDTYLRLENKLEERM